MGLIRNLLEDTVEFVRDEILPVRHELMKAGIISPPSRSENEGKAALNDPWSYNTMNYGYKEKYSFLDYSRAKQVSYADPIISAIIATRQNHVASQSLPQRNKFQNGFKIRMRDQDKKPSSAAQKKIKELETFIVNCGFPETFEDSPAIRRRDNFETFLRKITRDSLTYDQVNFEVVPRKNGLPSQFMAVDASTIRIIPDQKERQSLFTGYNNDGTNREMYSGMGVAGTAEMPNSHKASHPRFAQLVQGTVRSVFDEWEMAFGIRNPRTDLLANGYGFSEIEMLIATITAHMNADTYNRRFFSQGSSIKGILTFEGTVPPDQLESFRRQWHQQVTGVSNAWKTPIMALGKDGKLNWTDLHQSNRDMEWGKYVEYLIKVICSVYQIDPVEIGFDISKQSMGAKGGSGGLAASDMMERVQYSQDKGLAPLLRFISSMLNDYLIWRIDEDFEFEFPYARKEDDELEQKKKEVETLKTINEARAEYDMKPFPSVDEDPDFYKNPANYVQSQTFIQAIGVAQGIGQPQGMDGQGQGQLPEGEDDQFGQGQDEPDYENMTTEELQTELDKLNGGESETKKSLDIII